jgi:hypothetical protein
MVNNLAKIITPKYYQEIQVAFENQHLVRTLSFSDAQLMFMYHCINQNVEGECAEVGVFEGTTTIMLNKYMQSKNINKKYFAIDTFSGFTQNDIDYEVTKRNKDPTSYILFKNSKATFDARIKRSNITNVISIQADVNSFNFSSLDPLSFVLLDVDLYLPIKRSIKELYSIMTSGGIIVVDNCEANSPWDGAKQAYEEFMQEHNWPTEIIFERLGIVRKP